MRPLLRRENIPETGVPESFKVLIKEMQGLCLDVQIHTNDGSLMEIKESSDEDNDMPEYDRASMGELDDTDEVSIGQLKAKGFSLGKLDETGGIQSDEDDADDGF